MEQWQLRTFNRGMSLLVLVSLVLIGRHYLLGVHPNAHPKVQRITLMNRPRPEAEKKPEPEVKAPEPQVKPIEPKQWNLKPHEYSLNEGGPPGPKSPIDDNLGVDASGAAGADSFGLVGKPGGQDVTTLGGISGQMGTGHGSGPGDPMAKYAIYATQMGEELQAEINKHQDLRTSNYKVIVMVWVESTGLVQKAVIAKSSGDTRIDNALRNLIVNRLHFSKLPPADMPQPIGLSITSSGATRHPHDEIPTDSASLN